MMPRYYLDTCMPEFFLPHISGHRERWREREILTDTRTHTSAYFFLLLPPAHIHTHFHALARCFMAPSHVLPHLLHQLSTVSSPMCVCAYSSMLLCFFAFFPEPTWP